jgi:mannose-6-phosphate isomerase-like protein (cupin superfamily)
MARTGWRLWMRTFSGCATAAVALALTLGSGATPSGGGGEAVLDALFPDGRRTESLRSLAESEALGPGESFRIVEVGRDENSSHHLVWIRDREIPHRHDRHDLLVVMLRGSGGMRLGDEERPVGAGSILYVPRGTAHAFRNYASEPAVTYAVYTPAFDGKDRAALD